MSNARYKGNHPDRVPGVFFRAMAALWQEEKASSRGTLAKELGSRLKVKGVHYHLRTIRRHLSGSVSTVPSVLEREMRALLMETTTLKTDVEIEAGLQAAGLSVSPDDRASASLPVSRIRPLVQLWLHLNPNHSKRVLALKLSKDLGKSGIHIGHNHLQVTLAGKIPSVRREVLDRLLFYLSAHGIGSEASALKNAEALLENFDSRNMVSTTRLRDLARVWQWRNRGKSKRQLALALQRELADQGISSSFHYLQTLLNNGIGRSQKRILDALLSMVENSLPPHQSLDDALNKVSDGLATADALEWVKTEPIADLAQQWLKANPKSSKRQLAIRVAQTARKMGYAANFNTIQTILKGNTKHTRGYIYRAMLKQLYPNRRLHIPARHFRFARLRKVPSPASRNRGTSLVGGERRVVTGVEPDPLNAYLNQMRSATILSRDEEVGVATRIDEARKEILHAVINSHAGQEALLGGLSQNDKLRLIQSDEAVRDFEKQIRSAVKQMKASALLFEKDDAEGGAGSSQAEPVHRLELVNTLKVIGLAEKKLAQAKAEMTEANLKLVVWIARKYAKGSMPLMDLIQEGNIGLMKAVDKYDINRGTKFSTYAGWWIRLYISRAIPELSRMIRLPAHLSDTLHLLTRAARELRTQLGREPTRDELATRLDITPDKVNALMKSADRVLSLDVPANLETETRLVDLVEDKDQVLPSDAVVLREMSENVRQGLATLSPREQKVIRMRFGIDEDDEHTLQAVGQDFGLSRERIRQIETVALKKLKNTSPIRKLEPSFEH